MEDWNKINKEREINQAKAEITEVDAAILLASNNILACEIHIAGMKIGICDNSKIVPALKFHKSEIEKFLKGEKNKYSED